MDEQTLSLIFAVFAGSLGVSYGLGRFLPALVSYLIWAALVLADAALLISPFGAALGLDQSGWNSLGYAVIGLGLVSPALIASLIGGGLGIAHRRRALREESESE